MNKEKLTMIELFSGIGMQKRGVENTNLFNLELLATSDIDKDAMVSYSVIHNGLTNDMVEKYNSYPTREKMIEELVLRNIGMNFEKGQMYNWEKLAKRKKKDIEKYWLAMKLQNNLGDISKIKKLPLADFWFYSSCCQDLSVAGKMKGMSKGSGTRSGLLWEVERLLEKSVETDTMPKYLCLENVKNMVSKKFKPDFDLWVKRLEELGYNSYYQILNGKNCGIPQNRERIFMLSIRKDIDNEKFEFPKPFDNGLRLKDILEDNVEEKYYINTERARNLIEQLVKKGQLDGIERKCCDSTINDPNTREISNCITARYDASIQNQKTIGLAVAEPIVNTYSPYVNKKYEEFIEENGYVPEFFNPYNKTEITDNAPTLTAQGDSITKSGTVLKAEVSQKRLGGMFDEEGKKHQAGSVWDTKRLAPTLDTMQGGYRMPCVVDEKFSHTDNDNKPIYVGNTTPSGKSQCNAVYDANGISQTLCAGTHGYATGSIVDNYRIRKLTPKETFLLMGLTKEDAEKCMDIGQSNSALYKQSGNGIITNCVELIFEHLYKAQYDDTYVCTDENFTLPQID